LEAALLSLLVPGARAAGLKLLAKAREESGLLICTEAMDPEGVSHVAEVADIVQIGARNMQNFSLLKAAGPRAQAVLLKRGLSATIEELLLSAEYLLAEGNHERDSVRARHPGLRHDDA